MTVTAPKTLEDWLNELVTAATSEDRRTIGLAGVAAGLAMARVTCGRCESRPTFTFTGAVRHLNAREAAWHETHPGELWLHTPGDLRAAPLQSKGPVWPKVTCRGKGQGCGAEIIWATTIWGNKMPVDAKPDQARGTLILEDKGGLDAPLVRVVINAERDRPLIPAEVQLHTSHFVTCPQRDRHRRRR